MKVNTKDIDTLRNNLTRYVQEVKDVNISLHDSLQNVEEMLIALQETQNEYVNLIKTYRYDTSTDYYASFTGNIQPKTKENDLAADAELNKTLRKDIEELENGIALELGNFKKSFKEFSIYIQDATEAYAHHKELWAQLIKEIEKAPKS
jgi:translation initiation factor RLI1